MKTLHWHRDLHDWFGIGRHQKSYYADHPYGTFHVSWLRTTAGAEGYTANLMKSNGWQYHLACPHTPHGLWPTAEDAKVACARRRVLKPRARGPKP